MQKYLLLLSLCFGLSMSAQEVQLSWNNDMNVTKALAKSESKPILIYFTKNDCESCMQFYSDFFKSDSFKSQINDFVFLMLDGSNSDIKSSDLSVIKQRRLIGHYNQSLTFPSVMILDSNGQTLGEPLLQTDANAIQSYMDFLATLK